MFIDDHSNGILSLIDDQTHIIGGHHKKFPLTRFMYCGQKFPVLYYGIFSAAHFQSQKVFVDNLLSNQKCSSTFVVVKGITTNVA